MGSVLSTAGLGGTPSSGGTPIDSKSMALQMDEKALEIEECLSQIPVNLWHLRELALTRGGLLQGKLRQRAWTHLVGLSNTTQEDDAYYQSDLREETSNIPTLQNEEEKKLENEQEQELDLIRRDVGRSVLFRYKTFTVKNQYGSQNSSSGGEGSSEVQQQQQQHQEGWSVATPSGESSHEDSSTTYASNLAATRTPSYASDRLAHVLENTITTAADNPERIGKLHYYQGLHDIAGVLLHNMGYNVTATTTILRRVCQSHLRDAMRENFGNITWLIHSMLLPLIEKVDANVHYALVVSDVELSNVCLSWLITWFTHDIHHHAVASRMVDAFLSGHPLLPLYFAVALMTHPMLRKHLLNADFEDPASMFLAVKKLPKFIALDTAILKDEEDPNKLTTAVSAQELIEDAIAVMQRYPPRALFDLVDSDQYSRQDLLNRVSSVSLFKAPSSWSMAGMSTCTGSWSPPSSPSSTSSPTSVGSFFSSSIFLPTENSYVRSRLASGVPVLMAKVDRSSATTSSSWGSRRHLELARRKRRLSKLAMYKRILFSPFRAQERAITAAAAAQTPAS